MDQDIVAAFSTTPPEKVAEPGYKTEPLQTRAAPIHLPVRPWVRLLARSFDILLFSVAAEALAVFIWPGQQTGNFLLFGLVPGILLYLLFDALLMAAFGTTPGKRLLKISVVPGSWNDITLRESLRRSFNVGWRGLAFGLPIINLISLHLSRKRLLEKGKSQWDERGHFYVLHEDIGIAGPLALIFFSALLLLIGSILTFLMAGRSQWTLPEYRAVEKLPSILPAPAATLANRIFAGHTGNTAARQKTRQTLSHLKIPHPVVAQSKAHREEQEATEIDARVFAELNTPAPNAPDKHLQATAQKARHHPVRHHSKKASSSVRRSSDGHKSVTLSNKKPLAQAILPTGVSTNHQNSSRPAIHLKSAFAPAAGTYASDKAENSAHQGTGAAGRNPTSAATENSQAGTDLSEIGSADQTDKPVSQTNASDAVSSNETQNNHSEHTVAPIDSGDRAAQISDGEYAAQMAGGAPVDQNDSGAPVVQNDSGAPVDQNDSGAPVVQIDSGAPVDQIDNGAPVVQIDSGTPGNQADSGAPVVRIDSGEQVNQIGSSSAATQADGGAPVIEINDGAVSKQAAENGGAQRSANNTGDDVTLSALPASQQPDAEQSMGTRQQDSTAVLDDLAGQGENNSANSAATSQVQYPANEDSLTAPPPVDDQPAITQ